MARTDDEILVDVVDALLGDARLDVRDLNVQVSRGRVTLSGVAPDASQQLLAQEMTSRIKGVTGVVNRLRVEAVPMISDDAIAESAREALSRDPLVTQDLVQVQVENRVVRLTGRLESLVARSSAEDDVRLVAGVKDVINDIEVLPSPHRTDREIMSDIQRRLLDELSLGASEIVVTVQNGMVELRGSVSSADLKRRVEEVARQTPGVLGVESDVVVIA